MLDFPIFISGAKNSTVSASCNFPTYNTCHRLVTGWRILLHFLRATTFAVISAVFKTKGEVKLIVKFNAPCGSRQIDL